MANDYLIFFSEELNNFWILNSYAQYHRTESQLSKNFPI